MEKMWSGRFAENTDQLMDLFNTSIFFDKELFHEDIRGSVIHAEMLKNQKILSSAEYELMKNGLLEIQEDIEKGRLPLDQRYEDIHMAVESELTKRIGDVGAKLHTARSRNDQVVTDFKMWLRNAVDHQSAYLKELLHLLCSMADEYKTVILPGFTHLQAAQPITLGFYYMAWFRMFHRDLTRLQDFRIRFNECPLGSGAFCGVNYETDRFFTAQKLGFDRPTQNAMDSVCDRDFAVEYLSAAVLIMTHLSRLNEEMILWSNKQFGFITIDDKWSTGSSIMPNKKNPDACELIRGKTGRVLGSLTSLLTVLKSLPLAYNKDMQEDKEPVFDTVKTLNVCLKVIYRVLDTLTFHPANMRKACENGYIQATDVADFLTVRGLPFRQAHEVSGKIVAYLEKSEKNYGDMTLDEYRNFSSLFTEDIFRVVDLDNVLNNKTSYGATGKDAVETQIEQARKILKDLKNDS